MWGETMDDMTKFPYNINFEKDYYTIPEVIKILVEEGKIPLPDKKGNDTTYKTMYQSLRRMLISITKDDDKKENSGRKQRFPKDKVVRAVNERANFLRGLSPMETDQTAYWAKEAKDYRKKVREQLAKDGLNQKEELLVQDDGGCQEYIDEVLKKMQEQIMWDFLTHYFFDFERLLLEHDLTLEFTFDEMRPTPEGVEAIRRLENLRNYYTPKKKSADLL